MQRSCQPARWRLLAGVLLTACVSAAALEQRAPLRVMPVGDSITQGTLAEGSYRKVLFRMLARSGYEVDFVGSQRFYFLGAEPTDTGWDPQHESYWGAPTGLAATRASSRFAQYQPHVALVHLGTNDLYQGIPWSETRAAFEKLVHDFRAVNPQARVLLARIIGARTDPTADKENDPYNVAARELNDRIAGLAAELNTAQSPVLIVDMYTPFDPAIHTNDGYHPNEAGTRVLAAAWFNALTTLYAPTQTVPMHPRAVLAVALLLAASAGWWIRRRRL
jgi:lysophospholipase L1-like esterase